MFFTPFAYIQQLGYIPLSFANVSTSNTDSSFPGTYGISPVSYTNVYFIKNGIWNYTHVYSNNIMSYGSNYYDTLNVTMPEVTQLSVGDNINFYFQTGNNYNQGYFTIYFSMYLNGSLYTTIGYGNYTTAAGYAFGYPTGFTIPSGTRSIGFTFTATAIGAGAGAGGT
jgi:hypothetical protein